MKKAGVYRCRDDIGGGVFTLKGSSARFLACVAGVLLLIAGGEKVDAADTENCLMCHRYRGLARVDKEGDYRLFYVDEELFGRGPHTRVSCTGCHADIDKVPHDNAEPVDCIRSCHIEEPTREIIFTHEAVMETLEGSVHSPIEENGTSIEHPEDLPVCKDCHDMPLFRPVAMFKSVRSGVSESAVSRCMVCHKDERFIRYFYSHVTTRLHKARDPREVVDMCGKCHGDAAMARRHGLSDAVSSYLETFHGKAVLLGSSLAPDCLDCHSLEGKVHEMLASADPCSVVHAANRAGTCNSHDCHSTATANLASFDVHATRNPATHTLEFAVALFFVIMTLAILLPVLTLNILGYIRELFPSHEAEEEVERLTKIAERQVAREGRIIRFRLALRVQHALLVLLFVVLCLTGFPLKFAHTSWAPVVLDLFGGIGFAPVVHRIAGVALLAGFILHAILILVGVRRSMGEKDKRGLWAFIKEFLGLPMVPKPSDLGDIITHVKYVCFLSPKKPNFGRFSWKEKLEYIGLIWGTILLGVTGILLWGESLFTQALPGWLLNICYIAHTYESLLAVAHIALVHIPGAIGRPGVSPFSSMILDGSISPKMLAEEHGGEIIAWGAAKEVK
ncbi:MAG: formate dehydrogenase subunit gamma [Planctomycetota bacterium]|jgi:cytochrome b subunit of formate dehydrogenase